MTATSTTHVLELSPTVSKQFRNHHDFEFGAPQTSGMLFGIVDIAGQGQVHYAPPFLPQNSPDLRQHDYAYGRYEASIEAAYHLHGWVNLGYWLAYQGDELSPDDVLETLLGSIGGEMPLPEQMLLTLRRTPAGLTEMLAFTYTSCRPVAGIRELTIIQER